MKLSGHTVLITGGSVGIGYSLAELFLEQGNEVIICGRREEKLLEAQRKHPDLHIKVCDVGNKEDQKSLFNWATANFPNLNVLINNAGIQRDIDFTKGTQDLESGDSEIQINFEGLIYLSALFIPHLMSKNDAAIVNVSSGLGFMPMATVPVYCATKAGVHVFTKCLRHQLAKTNVKIFEVIPPMVDTDLNKEARDRRNVKDRGPKPEPFAAAVMEGLEKDEFEITYGTTDKLKTASKADLDQAFMFMNRS